MLGSPNVRAEALREDSVAAVLSGHVSPAVLEEQVHRATERVNDIREEIHVQDMPGSFVVSRQMLTTLCEAVIGGQLSAESLRIVAFTLIASSSFEWDENLVGEVLHDWSAPEINLPLNKANLLLFKSWLVGEAPYPTLSQSEMKTKPGRVVSELTKICR